jgi:hypothetical protein
MRFDVFLNAYLARALRAGFAIMPATGVAMFRRELARDFRALVRGL